MSDNEMRGLEQTPEEIEKYGAWKSPREFLGGLMPSRCLGREPHDPHVAGVMLTRLLQGGELDAVAAAYHGITLHVGSVSAQIRDLAPLEARRDIEYVGGGLGQGRLACFETEYEPSSEPDKPELDPVLRGRMLVRVKTYEAGGATFRVRSRLIGGPFNYFDLRLFVESGDINALAYPASTSGWSSSYGWVGDGSLDLRRVCTYGIHSGRWPAVSMLLRRGPFDEPMTMQQARERQIELYGRETQLGDTA